MATNNLHIPDDLLNAATAIAQADGKTTDELAADAVRRYLAHRKLGYTEADVPRLIAESRREQRGR